MEDNRKDLLTDFIEEPQLIQASGGKRFINFLVDYIIFIALLFGAGILWALLSPDTISAINDNAGSGIIDRILTLLLYGFYMGCVEAVTRGRSLGKLITGTKAVNEDGSVLRAGTAFKRGFSRVVPFEIFSALGAPSYPWHDKWNHTYVVDIKQSYILTGSDQIR